MASPERSSAAVQRTERSISEAQKRRLEEYKEPLKDVDPPARLSWRSSSENHISIAVKKGGFLYMAKSWAIRTSLSTSIGQAVILQRMGPHASSLIEALTECVKLLKGSKEAKEFKR